MIRFSLSRLFTALTLLGLLGPALGCSTGPRMKWLTEERYPPRPSIYPIEIFAGQVQRPHREIALIESRAYDIDDVYTREAQLEQLQEKARELGADAVDNLRILAKRVHGYTIDERAPAPAFKQGEYPLFFMRGRAIIYEASLDLIEPGSSPGQVVPEDIPKETPTDTPEGLAPIK
jgi:hypothetical protein